MEQNIKIPFIGRGWSFPPEFNRAKREVQMSVGAKDIQESLKILLSVKPEERLMHPGFGCDLSVLLFEPLDKALEKYVEDLIRNTILLHESRIETQTVNFDYNHKIGVIYIDIQYIIKATNSRTNIVFPFYLKEGTNL